MSAELSTAYLQLFAVTLVLAWFFLAIVLVLLFRWADLMHTVIFPFGTTYPKRRVAVGLVALISVLGVGVLMIIILTNTLFKQEFVSIGDGLFDRVIVFVPLIVLESFGLLFSVSISSR